MTSGGVALSCNRADLYLIAAWQVDKIVPKLCTNASVHVKCAFYVALFFGNAEDGIISYPKFVHKSTYFLLFYANKLENNIPLN